MACITSQDGEGAEEVVVADVDQLVWKILGRTETAELAGMDETQIARCRTVYSGP